MQTCSNINILNDLNISINVEENKYDLPLDNIFSMAARKNPKRSFLFVSKLIGKHFPINPSIGILTGCLLANELSTDKYLLDVKNSIIKGISGELPQKKIDTLIDYLQREKLCIEKNTLFIGFAETATGLGHAVFNNFKQGNFFDKKLLNYIHTTRDKIENLESVFDFEEEHSHATTHLCYAIDKNIFTSAERIVLVDDEISTGKTNLNLIRSLTNVFPAKEFVCMSILDWRNKEQVQKYKDLENELNIKIDVISMIKGTLDCNNSKIEKETTIIEHQTKCDTSLNIYPMNSGRMLKMSTIPNTPSYKNKNFENYLLGTGRFGLSESSNAASFNTILDDLKRLDLNVSNKTLVMGFGEFMFIPMMMAHKLNSKCKFSSPSLSPIYVSSSHDNYPLQNVDLIQCPYGTSRTYHIYNLNNVDYNDVVLILEKKPTNDFVTNLKKILGERGISQASLIYFN